MPILVGRGLLTNEGGASHKHVHVLRRRTHDAANQAQALAANEEPSPTQYIAEAANKEYTNAAAESLNDWNEDNIGAGTDVLVDDRKDIHLDRKIGLAWQELSLFHRAELTGRT